MKPVPSSSSTSSSPAVSPSGHRCLRKSKKQRQRKQTLDILREMIGCDKNVSALELIQLIMDHINRLQDVLAEDNLDGVQSNSNNTENVQALLRQLSLSTYHANISKSA
uniref:BHLH domain-containing protein n=1 Tax=Panagrolaimus sp. PS1159 TaxID=55785 RepID=A0AC35EYZ0_9BILA